MQDFSTRSTPHVLLLGAAGFIGRHVLQTLLARGVRVTAVCRLGAAYQSTDLLVWKALRLEQMLAA